MLNYYLLFRIFPQNVNNEQQNFYLMGPKNMENAFSLNINSNIPSASLREQFNQKLNRHTFSESNIECSINEPNKIILDDVIIYKHKFH